MNMSSRSLKTVTGMSVKRRNRLHNRGSVATVQSFGRRHQTLSST